MDDEIESGQLVALADKTVPSDSAYWLVTSQTDFPKPEVKQFRRWLLAELGLPVEHRKAAKSVLCNS
jgi:hypothetical protein